MTRIVYFILVLALLGGFTFASLRGIGIWQYLFRSRTGHAMPGQLRAPMYYHK
ncbi:MAG: hypothetical protein LW884_11135 [Bacteroidetes bacterium]|jgi:hypothetical protein|nr:hypothetical protein [Bacteroidota bacterium]